MARLRSNAEYLAQILIFAELGQTRLTQIGALCTRKSFAAGDLIFREGDEAEWVYFVLSGQAKVEMRSESGESEFVLLRGPLKTLGDIAMIENTPQPATAIAATKLRTLALSRDNFQNHVMDDPQIRHLLMESLAERVRDLAKIIVDRRATTIEQRLLDFVRSKADEAGVAHVGLSQVKMAELLGCSRGSVNHNLRVLVRDGAISKLGRGRFRVQGGYLS
ncbi:MAG: Crp/Fnr family transcriptional regulator [Armatimonadetes bacterium]|nr:Crp/Fnr family transcriptional regulator [Armatimonadota bacterium]